MQGMGLVASGRHEATKFWGKRHLERLNRLAQACRGGPVRAALKSGPIRSERARGTLG